MHLPRKEIAEVHLPRRHPRHPTPLRKFHQHYDPLMGADDVRRYHRPSAIDFQQHAGIFVNNIQPPPDRGPATGHRQSQSNPRLPPRMQALQMQNGRPDEIHRRSPRPYNGTQEVGGSLMDNIPVQTSHRRRSQVLGQAPYTPQIEPDQLPLFIDNNGFPAPGPISPPFESPQAGLDQMHRSAVSQQPQPPEPDSRSSHRSMTDSSRSTNSGNSRTLPPPNHIPKRLVMPAPLQSSQPVAPRHQPSHLQPPRHVDGPSWQPQLRPPSPLMVPTVLGPHIDGQLLRVQEVPMSQSRKLRKRISVQGLPAPLVAPRNPCRSNLKLFILIYFHLKPCPRHASLRRLRKKF
ncbi:hypothetical protein FPV67DRAFT_80220 [Lyophyllum atratum]|nr:hypothetical protein FPV67DRAFT_80220 [Lyophyllum atratum]